jgi:hypothetical protein
MILMLGGKKKLDDARHSDMVYSADFDRQGALDKENMRYAAEKLADRDIAPNNPMDTYRWQATAENEQKHKEAIAAIESNYKQAMAAANAPPSSNGSAAQTHEINVNVRTVNPSTGQATTVHSQPVSLVPRGAGTAVTNVPAN